MDLTKDFKSMGFSLADITDGDLSDFIRIEKETHNKYVAEHSWFFGEYNEAILVDAFNSKRNMAFFKKLILNGETVGFFSYDETDDEIKLVFIRIAAKAQSKGLGTWFLKNLMELSDKSYKPICLVAIKTNPAQELYRRLGFEFCEEKDAFHFFRYNPTSKYKKTSF